jgi:hypothetical protein
MARIRYGFVEISDIGANVSFFGPNGAISFLRGFQEGGSFTALLV